MKQVAMEDITNAALCGSRPALTPEFCAAAVQQVLAKIDASLDAFTDTFPAPSSTGNVYPAIDNVEWTSSFWTGMLWLAYEVTGKDRYRAVAEHQLASYADRLTKKERVQTHDLGFLYTLSCVAAYRLTGNTKARAIALKAANTLMLRYLANAGIIQAWGDLSDPRERGRMIIDCCMNLPLLFWASEQTGDLRYHTAAISHARMAAEYLVREDASSYHTFYMDAETGAPKFGKTAQGLSDTSCWARGQAWGMYGFALSYAYTHDSRFTEIATKLTNYFVNRLPHDHVCYWDLEFTQGAEPRDTSAAAIAACGLLETASHLPIVHPYRTAYENAALNIVESLAQSYTTVKVPESNGLLLHAVYSKPGNRGVDECCIWGDYYYFEALVRMTRDWQRYW